MKQDILKGERRRIIEQIRAEEREKIIKELTDKWYSENLYTEEMLKTKIKEVKQKIIKQIKKAERQEVDWEDMYEDLKEFIKKL